MKLQQLPLLASALAFFSAVAPASALESLVPDSPSKAPDYFCTWNVQGYATSLKSNQAQREAINESHVFGKGPFQNWAGLFPAIRADLYFVMDDSWDIPQKVNTTRNEFLGLTELDTTRFPSFTGTPAERLKKFADAIRAQGWKGAGGWICAQEAGVVGKVDVDAYWTERLAAAHHAGFNYWKVDWGKSAGNGKWREQLTRLGKKHAPNLWIEHAMSNSFLDFSDVFRTYDVENVTAQAATVNRVAKLLSQKARGDAKGIINCEDEPYIAAALGCAIGIMRHPFNGNFPDGRQDVAFPPVGRDLKSRLDEVVRGVRWHRIAEPFGVGGPHEVDKIVLTDFWVFQKRETWMNRRVGSKSFEKTPARVSRGLPLPEVSNPGAADRPVVLASLYPNGAVAVATVGRSLGREYVLRRETVSVRVPEATATVGIFGDYETLELIYPGKINGVKIVVLAQDLAGNVPVDITSQVKIEGGKLIIPGAVIRKVGLMAATAGDKSDPGLVLKIK